MQNYIPGVRLTGSLRIAPAITKDGKVRIAKATVQSDVNNPDRVALSACLFPAKRYNALTPAHPPTPLAAKIPTLAQVTGGGAVFRPWPAGTLAADGNTALPVVGCQSATRTWPRATPRARFRVTPTPCLSWRTSSASPA